MYIKNVNPHNSVDDSLEVFSPFPAYRDNKQAYKKSWLKFFKDLCYNKH